MLGYLIDSKPFYFQSNAKSASYHFVDVDSALGKMFEQ